MSRNIQQLGDGDIVKKIRTAKETELYSLLYKRYYPKVLDKCYSLTHSRDLAEELTGDILSRVYEKLDSYKGNSSFSS